MAPAIHRPLPTARATYRTGVVARVLRAITDDDELIVEDCTSLPDEVSIRTTSEPSPHVLRHLCDPDKSGPTYGEDAHTSWAVLIAYGVPIRITWPLRCDSCTEPLPEDGRCDCDESMLWRRLAGAA